MTASPKDPAPTRNEAQSPSKPSSIGQIDVSKLTDFEIGLLILERDVSQYRVERIDDLLNRIGEAKGFAEAEKKPPTCVPEGAFTILKFDQQKGEKLGEFGVAHKSSNLPDKWQHAYNILRQNNATIKNRYHAPNYTYSYWLYKEDTIYRQKLKATDKPAPASEPPNIFPKELVDMLVFEETANWTIIKPRQYLGSENFAKIAAIVKEHKGDYVSAGKESHFKLPKTA